MGATINAVKNILVHAIPFSAKEKAVLHLMERTRMARRLKDIYRQVRLPRTTVASILRKLERCKLVRRHPGRTIKWSYRDQIRYVATDSNYTADGRRKDCDDFRFKYR